MQLLLEVLKGLFGDGSMGGLKKMEFVIGNTRRLWELLVDARDSY